MLYCYYSVYFFVVYYSVESVTEEGLDIHKCNVVIRFDLVKTIFTFVHAGIQGKMKDYQLAILNLLLRLYAGKQ